MKSAVPLGPIATPDQLLTEPELAVLYLLAHTLQQALFALFAAHPLLIGGDIEHCDDTSPLLWIADSIQAQANTLQATIDLYRRVADAQRDARGSDCDF